jgi:hypothetical protein
VLTENLPGEELLPLALAGLLGALLASGVVSWLARRGLDADGRAAARRAVAGVRRANLALALPLAALVVGAFELGLLLLCVHGLLVLVVVQYRLAVLRLGRGYRAAQLVASLLAYGGLVFFLALVGDL